MIKWVKVFKNEPNKMKMILPPLTDLIYSNFKGCLPQILLGSFLNTLTHFTFNALTHIFIFDLFWKLRGDEELLVKISN